MGSMQRFRSRLLKDGHQERGRIVIFFRTTFPPREWNAVAQPGSAHLGCGFERGYPFDLLLLGTDGFLPESRGACRSFSRLAIVVRSHFPYISSMLAPP